MNVSYNEYLLELIKNPSSYKKENNTLKINLYLTLLLLDNSKYNDNIYIDETSILEDFLRKINNLKVKIQLKRKETEINDLIEQIKEILETKSNIIDKHNRLQINIKEIIDTKDPKQITSMLDTLTKEKINFIDSKESDNQLREDIISNINKNTYYIENNIININNTDITISIDKFIELFNYLLNINNYESIYIKQETNTLRKELIKNIIDIVLEKKTIDKEIIPAILTYLLTQSVENYELINTSYFKIDNIKITDLYSMAKTNSELINTNCAKWQKIFIPNEYLYQKIKEIVTKGSYYFKDDKFILENIGDFKVSILIADMKKFLEENIDKIKV